MDIHAKLHEMGLKLPALVAPLAAYVPAVVAGQWVFVAGQLPLRDGRLIATGRVAGRVGVEEAREAAQSCVLNALAAIDGALGGDWGRFSRVVRAVVYVASDSDFTGQSLVADGASDLLAGVLGEAGRHARVAVGVAVLPKDAPVELELQALIHG
jgi:enamine deaminase RidA (YjgF/YER057c/UK114 family)